MLSCLTSGHAANPAAIASAHPLATYAGLEILDQGGNAFDAAVAISAVLAVVEPAGSGLGGGGFWLLHRAEDGFETMIDGREKAPLAATSNMYLNAQGELIKALSIDGSLSAGIPGVPAALAYIAKNYGQLPLAEVLRPAIRYARNGFVIAERHRRMLRFRIKQINASPAAASIFTVNGELPDVNTMLRQPALANTLQQLADKGREGFYAGPVAEALVSAVQSAGGIWSKQDLADYQIVERKPVYGNYKAIKITSAAPPSSGGMVLLEILNILSGYPLDSVAPYVRKHLIVEAMRRAYHDRALFLGDPDFIDMPLKRLLSPDYAAGQRSSIRMDRALPSRYLSAVLTDQQQGRNTTHFSIIDQQGNRVADTLSVNLPFGSGFVAPGTGVLLNDEMDDFVSQVGAMNSYGLVGGIANAIAPGKRMLSSMTPTFLEDEQRIAVLGTPGGSRIISMVLLAILDFQAGHGPASWVNVPRFHHQFIPDEILFEKGGLSNEEIKKLKLLGHQLHEKDYRYGNMQAVQFDKQSGIYTAASDARGEGLAVARNAK